MRRINEAADIDAIIIDGGLPDPGLANLVAQLRADVRASRLPLIVAVAPEADETLKAINKQHEQERAALVELSRDIERLKDEKAVGTLERVKADIARHEKRLKELDADYARESARSEDKLRRFLEKNANTWVVASDVPLLGDSLGGVIKEKIKQADAPLPPKVREEYAERSMLWLGKIGRGELPGYDIRSSDAIPQLIYDSLASPALTEKAAPAALDIAGRLPNKESQHHLLAFINRPTRSLELRKQAGEELIRHIQQNGNHLARTEIVVIFDLYKDEKLAKELRPMVNTLVGLMQPDERTTGDRLKGFEPKIGPPPAPPDK
jgi:CheY-like chemotaxis protein